MRFQKLTCTVWAQLHQKCVTLPIPTSHQILPFQCPGRGSNPYAPCGAPDFKSGASASSATQALLFSMNYRSNRFWLSNVAYLSPMEKGNFYILLSLCLNHSF